MKQRIFFTDSSKSNIVGIILCTKIGNDIEYNVYKNNGSGLKLLDINGSHSYVPSTTKQVMDSFVKDYTNNYFSDCYYEEEN